MEKRGEEAHTMETHQRLFKIQQAVNRVSLDLRRSHDSPDSDSSTVKALLELWTASGSILSGNPLLCSLSQHLSQLVDSVQELHNSKPSRHGPISFVTRRVRSHEVSRLAAEVEAELQALIDPEMVSNLTKTLAGMRYSSQVSVELSPSFDEDKLFDEMSILRERLSRGFDINLQDLLLKSGIFAELEWVLCNHQFSKGIREKAAILMKELVLFNKDVFVGSFLVGRNVEALVSMGTLCSLQALSSLIKAIRSPLVDEIESCGGIHKIVSYLSSDDLDMKLMAMDCVMKIGYFGRKEAIEAMINGDIVKKLVELQRLEVGGDMGEGEGEGENINTKCREIKHSFGRCVARFAVQLEVGEGLRQREKRAFKQQVLSKVREASSSDAESATILAEGNHSWNHRH